MKTIYVLYNPYSGNKDGKEKAEKAAGCFAEYRLEYSDITKINDCGAFFGKLNLDDAVLLCGGDGTLNRFVNKLDDTAPKNDIYYCATGNGNDFLRDLEPKDIDKPVKINDYIKNLPTVTVKGKTYRFINGIGFGVDGYCCEVGDRLRAKGKVPNYTAIAIKGLLFHYKPTNASVTVDGETKQYKKVWIAPTMYGRYYGGGMLPAPEQRRGNESGTVSFAAIYGSGKLKTLIVFPKIFKGEHVKHTEMVETRSGKHVIVEFDRPVALQIDGETVLDVSKYEVKI